MGPSILEMIVKWRAGYVYDEWQELFLHRYEHFGIDGLEEFARRHKSHILQPFDMISYTLKARNECLKCFEYPCHSFNFPIQPNAKITEDMIESYLLRILNTLDTRYKARVGVSRNLMSHAPMPTPALTFYRCEHDNFSETEMEGGAGKKDGQGQCPKSRSEWPASLPGRQRGGGAVNKWRQKLLRT